MKKFKINEQIKDSEVRVIDQDENNLGVISTKEAIGKAREAKLDLVEVSSGATPSVCRIVDYNKYAFEQKAKLKKQSKSKKTVLKEFIFGPNIGEGDLRQRIERGRGFLESGNMVKYSVQFKGRQNAYPEFGVTKLKIVESELADVSKATNEPEMKGNLLSLKLIPAKK